MQITGGRPQPYVPFLLKLPFQQTRVVYNRELNTVVTGDLIFESLKEHLKNPEDVVKWLDDHTSTPENANTAHGIDDPVKAEPAEAPVHK
jgi:hypothetical protein